MIIESAMAGGIDESRDSYGDSIPLPTKPKQGNQVDQGKGSRESREKIHMKPRLIRTHASAGSSSNGSSQQILAGEELLPDSSCGYGSMGAGAAVSNRQPQQTNIPISLSNYNSMPLQHPGALHNMYGNGLPPIPLRRRADSFGDRSAGDLSSNSPRMRPKVPRSGTLTPPGIQQRSPTYATGVIGYGGHPLHKRRVSDGQTAVHHSDHRRIQSFDVSRSQLKRGSSSNSLYSLGSQGSLTGEQVRLLPDPRWGNGGSRARSFSGGSMHQHPVEVVGFGYGSTSGEGPDSLPRRHKRASSELSAASGVSIDQSVDHVTTDMSKSTTIKGVTQKGKIQYQLPKDQFRLLCDRDLESGCVYKRQLVDDEDEYFQEYHIVDDVEADLCNQKTLPPEYYVMAVDNDIYKRILDEVIESKSMPCDLFFCGHHADVRYPSIMLAAVPVSCLFIGLMAASIYFDS